MSLAQMTNTIDQKTFRITVGVAIAVIIALFVFAYNTGKQVESIENHVGNFDKRITQLEEQLETSENNYNSLNIRFSVLETKLNTIENLAREIKQEIREANQ